MSVFRFVLTCLNDDMDVSICKGNEVLYTSPIKSEMLEWLVENGLDTAEVLCWRVHADRIGVTIASWEKK